METILLVPSKLIVLIQFMMFDFGALFYFVYLMQFHFYEKQLAIFFEISHPACFVTPGNLNIISFLCMINFEGTGNIVSILGFIKDLIF